MKKMKKITAFILSLVFCLFVLTACDSGEVAIGTKKEPSTSSPYYEVYSEITSWLDDAGFKGATSIVGNLDKYTYKGQKLSDACTTIQYDKLGGGGVKGGGESVYFCDDYEVDSKGKTWLNQFSFSTNLGGMEMPYGIKIGDDMLEVVEKIGLISDPLDNFVSDANNPTDMTLWQDGGVRIIFRDMRRTLEPADYEDNYSLIFSQSDKSETDKGDVTSTRSVIFSFSDATLTLKNVEIKTIENLLYKTTTD